jgi:hypothetical protein
MPPPSGIYSSSITRRELARRRARRRPPLMLRPGTWTLLGALALAAAAAERLAF